MEKLKIKNEYDINKNRKQNEYGYCMKILFGIYCIKWLLYLEREESKRLRDKILN